MATPDDTIVGNSQSPLLAHLDSVAFNSTISNDDHIAGLATALGKLEKISIADIRPLLELMDQLEIICHHFTEDDLKYYAYIYELIYQTYLEIPFKERMRDATFSQASFLTHLMEKKEALEIQKYLFDKRQPKYDLSNMIAAALNTQTK